MLKICPALKRKRVWVSREKQLGLNSKKVARTEKGAESAFWFATPSQAEEKAIAQALENSKIAKIDSDIAVDSAPVFYPTLEEFENPIAYIINFARRPLLTKVFVK